METHWRPLPEPRRLTPAEQALLDRLVAQVGSAELRAQAANVFVTARCGCGCPSVRLRSDAPALAPIEMALLSSFGRDDWFSVGWTGADQVSVVLHVMAGTLHELEIFAGEGISVALPPSADLIDITLT